MTCLGYLRQIFERLAAVPLRPLVAQRSGLRVEADERPFDEYVDLLVEVAAYSANDLRVTESLVDVLLAAASASASVRPERVERLRAEVRLLAEAAAEHARGDRNLQRVRRLQDLAQG